MTVCYCTKCRVWVEGSSSLALHFEEAHVSCIWEGVRGFRTTSKTRVIASVQLLYAEAYTLLEKLAVAGQGN